MQNYREMISTEGVACLLHIHPNTVRRWSSQGIIKSIRIGPRGDRRFFKDEILTLLYPEKNGIAKF